MSEEDLFNLKQQVEGDRHLRENPDDRALPDRNVEDWLLRREKNRDALSCKGDLKNKEDGDTSQAHSDVPQQLLSIPDLPPSLLPPPAGGWKCGFNTEWG